jgi:GDP-L-fucose synthase
MEKSSKIYIAGHRGMVGSAIWRELHAQGYSKLLGRTRNELDLLSQVDVLRFFSETQPEYVILAAA